MTHIAHTNIPHTSYMHLIIMAHVAYVRRIVQVVDVIHMIRILYL